jgi:3-hydroxy-9,10-secoandrosta-1,3,5(10)-triene-9,17-dione monooxygenase reductase component
MTRPAVAATSGGQLPDREPTGIAPDRFRHVLGHYPTGVVIVSAQSEDGSPIGMVIGSFTSVSLDPPLVGFFPARTSRTWAQIERAGRFCVNMLASDQIEVCRRFSAQREDRFDEVAFGLSDGGCPVLAGIVGWIDCSLHQVIEAGDHYFVLGRVTALDVERAATPMLFCRGSLGAPAVGTDAG